jgi:hypothetical protein
MKYFLFLALPFLLQYVSAQTADDIINKNINATGGVDKWSKVYSIKYSGNYVMGPGMLAPVSEVDMSKPFKGYYQDFSWQGMTSKQAMRADSGWNYNPFGGKRESDPLSPNDIRSINLSCDPQGMLFNYKQKGYTVDYLGTDDMDGTDVYKLRLTTKEGDMVYYYIDAETYYILKTVDRVKLKDKEEKSYVTFSDFRTTDYGVVVPFSAQRVDENGNEQGGPVVYTKVIVNGPLDAAIFNEPKNAKQ